MINISDKDLMIIISIPVIIVGLIMTIMEAISFCIIEEVRFIIGSVILLIIGMFSFYLGLQAFISAILGDFDD